VQTCVGVCGCACARVAVCFRRAQVGDAKIKGVKVHVDFANRRRQRDAAATALSTADKMRRGGLRWEYKWVSDAEIAAFREQLDPTFAVGAADNDDDDDGDWVGGDDYYDPDGDGEFDGEESAAAEADAVEEDASKGAVVTTEDPAAIPQGGGHASVDAEEDGGRSVVEYVPDDAPRVRLLCHPTHRLDPLDAARGPHRRAPPAPTHSAFAFIESTCRRMPCFTGTAPS
jgi:hypothetical protein